MEHSESLLKESGFNPYSPDKSGNSWILFFTSMTFHQGKTKRDLYKLLHAKMACTDEEKKLPGEDGSRRHVLHEYFEKGIIQIQIVAATFGDADAVIVWLVKSDKEGWEAAKAFRDDSLTNVGTTKTSTAAVSDGWRK